MTAMRPLSVRRAVSSASAFAVLAGSSALLFTALATSAEAVTVSGVNCRTLSTTKPWNAPTTDEPAHSLLLGVGGFWITLAIILGTLGAGILASIYATRRDALNGNEGPPA